MATIEQLKKALVKAHNSGDKEAAELFASKIKSMNPAQSKEFSKIETLKNVPSSALQYAKDITAPIHSYDTFWPALGNLAKGAVQKFIPGEQDEERYVNAIGQYYSDRYSQDDYPGGGVQVKSIFDPVDPEFLKPRKGDIDNFTDLIAWRNKNTLQTLQKDPVGTLSDASLFGSLATAPVRFTKAGATANKVAIAADPLNVLANSIKTGVKKLTPKNKAAEMYESAAKFSTTIPKKERNTMVQTALDEGITPTGRGVEKLERTVDIIDSTIEGLISDATNKGGKVPASSVFKNLSELRKELGSATQTDGIGNLEKIAQTAKKIGENQKRTGKEFYTITELQKLKRNLYKDANFDIKQSKADPAINQARKNIANKSKTLIEEKIPDIKNLNERYGKLIDLQPHLTRSANRIDNRNFLSINQPLNTSGGYLLGGPAGAAGASALTALGNPKIKPQLAIYLNKLKKAGLLDIWMDNNSIPYSTRQGLLQVERSSDQKTKQ